MRSRQVRNALRDGRRIRGERVILFVAPGSGEFAVITARRIGGAVERNRARRVMRAAWSEVAPDVQETTDIVLVAREAIRSAKTQDLVAEMRVALRRAELTPV